MEVKNTTEACEVCGSVLVVQANTTTLDNSEGLKKQCPFCDDLTLHTNDGENNE